jgi:hypothetical protein
MAFQVFRLQRCSPTALNKTLLLPLNIALIEPQLSPEAALIPHALPDRLHHHRRRPFSFRGARRRPSRKGAAMPAG